MHSPILDYLDTVIRETEGVTSGANADYIPELAAADPDKSAVAISTVNGTVYSRGDDELEFSIQSMSKPFAYALAIEDRGLDYVTARIGVEPSGDAFNELSLDQETGHPLNPMINAGAIATHSLLLGGPDGQPVDRMLALFSELAQREISIDESVAKSELDTADRNMGLAYLLHATEALCTDPTETVTGYIRQCAASVTVRDLALMAATLANGGIQPNTGKRVFSRETNRQVLSVMATCGMYDAAGNWLTTVGIPAKSGVAGGIIGVLPGQVGVASFSPRLDPHGNSARGVAMMERLSADMELHLMDVGRPNRTALREVWDGKLEGAQASVYTLQGDMTLSTIEALTYTLVTDPPKCSLVVFDLGRVDEVRPVARLTSSNMATKLLEEGYRVVIVDPENTIPDFADRDGNRVEMWSAERLAEARANG